MQDYEQNSDKIHIAEEAIGKLSNKQSGSEEQMIILESSIMKLDELIGMLKQRLMPVLTDQEMAERTRTDDITKAREPQSQLAMSLAEKNSRITAITYRVQDILNKLDI